MILLIGSEGSMGKRYQSILNYIGKAYVPHDQVTGGNYDEKLEKCDHVIIASPTWTHHDYLLSLAGKGKRVLCEKPITHDKKQFNKIVNAWSSGGLTMMMQYKELLVGHDHKSYNGETYYDYYHSGRDGLDWDCIQIIALANTRPTLNNKSPIWKCCINGVEIERGDMDQAYVNYVQRWLMGADQSIFEIIEAHEKVWLYQNQ